MKKRLVAFLLVLIMVLGMLPVSALAADDGISPQAQESNETRTIKYQILYVGDEFNIGYNLGVSVNKNYTCQYGTAHSGYNHSILISEFRNVGVPALKGQLDSGYEFVGWAKEAKKNPTIFDFNVAGTTATQTTYTIYLVAKKTNPTPTYMYYLYYKYNDGTDSTWLTDVTDRPTAATTFTFNVNRAKLTRSGYDHIGWADSANATTVDYRGGDPIVLTKDNPKKTIYAIWLPIFELHYNANGGTGAPDSQTYTSLSATSTQATFTSRNQIPTKDGYTFKGWADSAAATTAQYQPGGRIAVNHADSPKTVYAVWEKNAAPIEYTVTYYKNDGSTNDFFYKTKDWGRPAEKFNIYWGKPTRDGYDFVGWAETRNATEAKYASGGAGGKQSWIKLDGPKVLYAVWQEAGREPEAPRSPSDCEDQLKKNTIKLVCVGGNHPDKVITFADISYGSDWSMGDTCKLNFYAKDAALKYPGHAPKNPEERIYVTFKWVNDKTDANGKYLPGEWVMVETTAAVVELVDTGVEAPSQPTTAQLGNIKVTCRTDAAHSSEFPVEKCMGTIVGTVTFDSVKKQWYIDTAPMTTQLASRYDSWKGYAEGTHRLVNPDAKLNARFYYDGEKWYTEDTLAIDVCCGETPVKPTALDGSFAIVCKNNKATHPHKADYIATPSQYTISDVQMDDQGYYVTATVKVAPNLAAYNTLTGVEHQLVNEQNATLTLTFRYDTEATGDENRKWKQQGDLPVVEVICKPKAPTADELKKLEMAVQVKCVVDASQQHTNAYGLLGEYDEDYLVGEPRKDGDDWLCDISYDPNLYVAEFNKTFPNPKHVQNDEKIVPVTLIWAGGSWQIKTQGRVHVTEEYTVTYTDGVDGEEVFADQVYSDLRKDSTTPAFNGTPTRTGYTFAGWEPEVAATVTQTVTYVAKWEAKKANVHLMIFKSGDLSTPIVNVPYTTDKLAGDTIDLAEIDPSSYLDFDFEIDGGWYDDGMFNSYKRYLNGLQDKPAGLEKLPITGNWQNLKLIVTELVPVVYFDSLESLTAYQNDHSKTEGILHTTKARLGSALPTADAPTATREGYTFTFWSREGQTGDVTGQTVNGWTNLYANWEKKTYKVVAKLYVNGKPAYYQNEDFYTYEVSGLYGEDIDFDTIKAQAVEQAKQIKKASASYTAVILEDHEPNAVCTTYGEHQPDQTTHYVKVNVKTEEKVVILQSFEGKTDLTTLHTTTAPYGTNVVEFLNGLGLDLDVAGYTLDTDEDGNTNWYKKDSPKWTFGANDTINGWTNVLLKYTITPHNIYAYLRTGDSIGDVLELNEATLNRLGLTKYNTEGFISIGTFVSNTLLTQDEYYGFDEDEAFLDVLAELQTKLVPETGVSLDKVGSKINWSWLYQPSDVDDRIAGYPTEDTDGYQLSGSLLLYGAKFEAGANDVTGMPTAAYGAYLDYFVSGESFNLPAAPTRPGYDFKGWKIGNAVLTAGAAYTVDEDDMVFTAQWEARTDTPYTVEHYLENLDGSYALDTTEPLKGTTDTTVTAAAKSYDNFTYDSTVPDTVASGNIAGDGSLVLKLFYTRNTYDYTVRHIKQLPDGSYDEANAEVETLSGKFEALAAVTAKDYGSHYPTNDADTKQSIKIEKGLTIDVKYDLDEHTLTFETNGGSAINPVTVRHGNAVARPADPTKDKYTFIGWYADPEFTEEYDFATVLEADKTIYAKFELTSTPIGDIYVRYDVLHIKQLPDGTYDLANAEVEHLSAKKDTTVTAVIKDYRATHHVNVNRTLSKLTGTAIQPYKGVDGKPVYTILSVYYDLDFHTLTFDTMGGSKIAPETVRHGLTVAKPKDPVNGGYIFDGWYTDKTFRHRYDFSTPLTEDITIYAKWFLIVLPGTTVKKTAPKLNTSDHFAYVQGYPNGTVKPAGNITRAETAAILFRLMDDASRKTYYSTKSGFRDVASGSWYNTYVATLNNAGVITDSSNGYFRPNEAITRAELAAMLAKFSETTGAANYFNDVSASYWAANAIAICAKLGWITGYPDGTFRPDKNVTRAELMAMINRATGRAPKSADAFLPGMKTWIDNTSDKWYYLDVQEATNSHSYTVKGSETWTALTSDPNWSLYE